MGKPEAELAATADCLKDVEEKNRPEIDRSS